MMLNVGASAQAPSDSLHMFFDDASDNLQLDTVYPAGCWQVGVPAKPVFTSAYSVGRALVTDTVSPYPDSTTCYAEFTLLASDPEYLGRSILFKQRRDMDSSTTASIEVQQSMDTSWHRYGTNWDEGLMVNGMGQSTDGTGYAFTGTSSGWEDVWLESPCLGVFWNEGQRSQRWYDPVMRVRLVFQSLGNLNGRDGWMIDNVRAGVSLCSGGLEERSGPLRSVFPNPASSSIKLDLGLPVGDPYTLELLRPDGALMFREHRPNTGSQAIDVSRLADGPYLLRVIANGQQASERIIVQH